MTFSCRAEFLTEPLAAALTRRGWQVVSHNDPASLLLAGAVDVVLTPPQSYAANLGIVDYSLVPGLAIMTQGFAGVVRLLFNPGLVAIGTIATEDPHLPRWISPRSSSRRSMISNRAS